MIVTYRVFQEENEQYTLRELFCDHDGRPIAYGKAPIVPRAGSLEELTQEIALLREALAYPVLTVAEVEAAIAKQPTKPVQNGKSISHEALIKKLGLESAIQQDLDVAVPMQ